MATYSWYGGNNEFKDTLGNGDAISGVLRYNNNEFNIRKCRNIVIFRI